MGLIIGLIGQKINLAGYQQIVSIVLGVMILAAVLLPSRVKNYFIQLKPLQIITKSCNHQLEFCSEKEAKILCSQLEY